MVVEEKPANRFAEMVRLNCSFDIAVDLRVVSEEKFQYWRDTPGNVYHEAATDRQVLYEGNQPLGLTAWVETDNFNQTRTMDGF